MEGKTSFSRRMKQFDGLTWLTLTPPPLFYDSYATARISGHFCKDNQSSISQSVMIFRVA